MKVYKTNNDTKYVVNARKVAKLPIVLFRAKEELREESEIIQEEWFKKEDWGWSDYADKSFNVEWIPGDHHTMMASPNVEVLAQKMQNYLG
jgi:thioesterase domain-containing protein